MICGHSQMLRRASIHVCVLSNARCLKARHLRCHVQNMSGNFTTGKAAAAKLPSMWFHLVPMYSIVRDPLRI